MSSVWQEVLGWSTEQYEEVRVLAYTYARHGAFHIAHDLLQMLMVLDPNAAYDCQLMGAIHLEQGESAEAVHWLQRARQLNREHLPTLMNLCKAQLEAGQRQAGLQLARQLAHAANPEIAEEAAALLLAHQTAPAHGQPRSPAPGEDVEFAPAAA